MKRVLGKGEVGLKGLVCPEEARDVHMVKVADVRSLPFSDMSTIFSCYVLSHFPG